MRVLVVCTGNFGFIKPFVSEQVDALNDLGIHTDYFLIKGKGILGYLRNLSPLKRKIRKGNYDIVHAHFGLSGLLACMQRKKPVVISYLTGEQLFWYGNVLSSLASMLSKKNIFVSESTYQDLYIKISKKKKVIPLGVKTEVFQPVPRDEAKKAMGIDNGKVNILFASDFTKNKFYKNPNLAFLAVEKIGNVNLIELKGYNRKEVNLLMNAVDLMLLTSKVEGSPMVAREAMACNCPVVATNVGDIEELFADEGGYFITSFNVDDVVKNIRKAIDFGRTNGRKRILEYYDNKLLAKEVVKVYREVLGAV